MGIATTKSCIDDLVEGSIFTFPNARTSAYRLVESHEYVVDGNIVEYWTYAPGDMQTGKFIQDAGDVYSLSRATDFLERFPYRWTPSPKYKQGDILRAANGTLFRVGTVIPGNDGHRLWYINQASVWASEANVVDRHGELEPVMTLSGKNVGQV